MSGLLKKTAIALALAAPLVLIASPAFANSQGVGGGTWNWGNPLGHQYSDYLHAKSYHSSSVQCGNKLVRGYGAATKWSNSSQTAISGCGFYWNNNA